MSSQFSSPKTVKMSSTSEAMQQNTLVRSFVVRWRPMHGRCDSCSYSYMIRHLRSLKLQSNSWRKCASRKSFLQMVVELQPATSHLDEIGNALLMRYVYYTYWHDKARLWFPPFFEGSCRRRWDSGISLKQGTLIKRWIPGFMCVTYRSRESITKHPTGFTGTESNICSGYWNFSCQIVQYSPSSRGWRRFGVGRFMLWA